jgi:CubicO group peptidase (beta-lactamase class C family)
MLAAFVRPRSLTARVFGNPRLRSAASLDAPAYRAVENPAAGGIGLVRDVARVYSALATGGAELGLGAGTMQELSAPAQPPPGGNIDLVLTVPSAYTLGFVRPSDDNHFGLNGRAFGHPGAGGSFAFADPDAGVAFAYAPNRHGHHLRDDPREKALRDAVYACL